MARIIWRPILDELDRAQFPFSAPEGWLPLDAWIGRDMSDDESEATYTLELVAGDVDDKPVRRAILWKFVPVAGTRATVKPAPIDEEVIAEAAEHVGFESFRTEPKGVGGLWIIAE